MQDDRKSNLEKFVKQNRQAFDAESPSRDLWPEVDQRILMSSKSTYRKEVWLWRAASVALLIVSAYLFVDKPSSEVQITQIAQTDTHEFDQVENFYVAQISEKRTQIDDFLELSIELDDSYVVDMQRLDAMYEVLKEELDKNPESEEVKDALTLNLLIRINLLNNQLQKIEESAPEKVEQST